MASNVPVNTLKSKPKKDLLIELPPNYISRPITDIGINLANERFDEDRDGVLDRAVKSNCKRLIITGTSLKSSEKAISLCKHYSSRKDFSLFCTVGIHPHDAKHADASTMLKLKNLIESNRDIVVAVGECGLDYDRMFSPQEKQLEIFKSHIDLALAVNLPLFLHERAAHDDMCGVLKSRQAALKASNISYVVHCFTGTATELSNYNSLECHIGLTGWICDPNRGQHLLDIIHTIPPNKLMLETDGPYLLPKNMPKKFSAGGRCEPAHITYVASKAFDAVAQYQNTSSITIDKFLDRVEKTTTDFFHLDHANK